jgi:hypothetical protein
MHWNKAWILTQDCDNFAKKIKKKLYSELQNLEKNKTKNGNIYRIRKKQFEETFVCLISPIQMQ